MMYKFMCSQRTVNIEKTKDFNNLYGDEISELVCEDSLYMRQITRKNLAKLSGLDIVTILTIHPKLVGHFYSELRDSNKVNLREWEYLLQSQPQFEFLCPHITEKVI